MLLTNHYNNKAFMNIIINTQTQDEETHRREDEGRRLQTQKSLLEEERKDRELQETKDREAKEGDRLHRIREIKTAEAEANKSNKENVNWVHFVKFDLVFDRGPPDN